MIEINHLVKTYGDHTAVDDLSLKVEPEEFMDFWDRMGQVSLRR